MDKVSHFPKEDFLILKQESQAEGFKFLVRLETEWINHENRFDKKGEGLYTIVGNNKLMGIGGINNNPLESDKTHIGRLRRFYIGNNFRRKGLGNMLLDKIIKEAKLHFNTIQLKTDNDIAAAFYEKNGFKKITNNPFVSHELTILLNDF